MRQVRVGIVGLGYGQRVLIPAFRSSPRCTVAAVCASSRERAQVVAGRLGVPKAYGDWRELVADPQVTAVAVATPPAIQPAVVKAALNAHKPVFCEKPLAITRKAAAELVEAVRQAGVAAMMDFEFPMIAQWQRAKSLLDNGAIEQVRHAVVCWQFETSTSRMGLESWKTRTEEGGGVLNLFVSHTFYYLEWLLGPIQRLSARLFLQETRPGSAKAEILAVLCLVLGDGTSVSVTVGSQACGGSGHRLELYGERGSLVLENANPSYVSGFRLWQGNRNDPQLVEVPVPSQPSPDGDDRIRPVGCLVERFLTWIEEGLVSPPALQDGYRVQCLIDAAREADHTGQWVEVAEELALRKPA
ncbi:MAG: Gfo/Idh/MocA family oxidoreductase [Candidatus Omnitrophica bacterium]|nr:Gfo/Idh/MocA family oxidoreductase [Candidatus Omnitrophota bacterium]